MERRSLLPILIEGILEASYPSSTTLLVLSVMPTLIFQVNRRVTSLAVKRITGVLTIVFSAFMVIGRLIAYTETTAFNRLVYWGMFLSLIVIGIIEIVLVQLKIAKVQKMKLTVSMSLSILAVLFLALTGETYATALAFLLFILKGFLYKH